MIRSLIALALLTSTAALAEPPAKPEAKETKTAPPKPAATTPTNAPPAGPPVATSTAPDLLDPNPAPATIKVSIGGLKDGAVDNASVFKGFGCAGDNKSLAVSWEGAPKDTKSFAVIVHDPDAPTGVGFFHWTVFNLPATTTKLDLGASGKTGGVEGYTDFGMSAYGGPCPPPGAPHRYIVTVYALKVPKLDGADAKSTGALLRFMLNGNALALGRTTATYGRK